MTNNDVVREAADAVAPGEPRTIGAVSVFIFRGDRLLALKRSARSDAAAGAWDAVSGRLREGEHPRDGALREAREETGLEVLPDESPVTSYSARRGGAPMLVVAYSAESAPGEVVLSAEHDEWAWMTIDEFARACTFPLLVDAARRAVARRLPADAAHVVLWEFRVRAGCEAAFEAAYGSEGDWARLFRRDPGYRGTELLRVAAPRGYLTIDRWASRAAFESFQKRHRKEYDALDRFLAKLTERETSLGSMTHVTPAPGAAARAALETRPPAAIIPELPAADPTSAAAITETSAAVPETPTATDGPPAGER